MNFQKNSPIGLFDSGVGGLSVLLEIRKLLPNETTIFLADQGHNPYGAKSAKELQDLSLRIANLLIKFKIKLLVVACNTATCYAIDHLRKNFVIPVVGVAPAIKPAIKLSKKKRVAVMATPATANSNYLKGLIAKYSKGANVLNLGCRGLEEAIEYLSFDEIGSLLSFYTQKIKEFECDVVVLGCTHYPFFKKEIEIGLKRKVTVVDSGEAIARRVKEILKKSGSLSKEKNRDLYFTTGNPDKFSQVASQLLKYKVSAQFAQI